MYVSLSVSVSASVSVSVYVFVCVYWAACGRTERVQSLGMSEKARESLLAKGGGGGGGIRERG